MADLIDRQELLSVLKNNDKIYWNGKGGGYTVSQDIIDEIRFMPNIDIEKHAHWIENKEWGKGNIEKIYNCSNCQYEAWGVEEKTDFCPNCGAKMN